MISRIYGFIIFTAICLVNCYFEDIHLLEAKESKITNEQQTEAYWIQRIENYLNTQLDSVISDFIQIDSLGYQSTGKIFLKRKKKLMKLYYHDPNPNVAIVKDGKLTHFDRELKEPTIVSVYSSPLSFFLDHHISIKETLKTTSFLDESNAISVTFCKKSNNTDGSIRLTFSKKPFNLTSWTIFENKNGSGKATFLILRNTEFNKKFSSDEFNKFSLSKQYQKQNETKHLSLNIPV